MEQEKQTLRLFDVLDEPGEKQDVKAIIKSLMPHCTNCRLGFLPANINSKGFFIQGNPDARVAVLADYPYPIDLLLNKFLSNEGTEEFQKWILSTSLKPSDLCYLYLVQCRTPEAPANGRSSRKTYKPPEQDEISKCFSERTLKVLREMPNLEVVLSLGPLVTKTLISGEVTKKSHEGLWFGSDLLPGVAIYCLPHPRDVANSDTSNQRGRALQLMEFFKNEYLNSGKILGILKETKTERDKERKKYVL